MRAANAIELVVRDTSVRARSVRFTAVVALATLLVGGRAARADDSSAGMRVYRDPETGEFTAPPESAAPATDAAAQRALATEAPELVEKPGTTPAGGTTIDLRGAFHSSMSASAEGAAVRTDCHTQASGAPAK